MTIPLNCDKCATFAPTCASFCRERGEKTFGIQIPELAARQTLHNPTLQTYLPKKEKKREREREDSNSDVRIHSVFILYNAILAVGEVRFDRLISSRSLSTLRSIDPAMAERNAERAPRGAPRGPYVPSRTRLAAFLIALT